MIAEYVTPLNSFFEIYLQIRILTRQYVLSPALSASRANVSCHFFDETQ